MQKNAIPEEEWEIYQYGYDTFLYSIEQTILLLTLGILFHQFFGTCLYITTFLTIRRYTGGYHASTRLRCTITTLSTWLFSIFVGNILAYLPLFYVIIGVLQIIYYLLIYRYTPVEHPDKPLSIIQRKENQKKGFLISIIITIITLLFSFHYASVAGILTCSMVSIAVLTIHHES